MITKERLQELIEQGATVYYIKHRNGTYIKPLTLEKDFKAEFIYRNLMLDEKDLYEHKSDAESDLKFGNVEKIIGVDERWDKNIPHNSKSKMLFNFLKEYDRSFCNDYFYWKSGGDGDNGELLMYQLDEYFDSDIYKQHEQEIRKQERQKVIAELEEWVDDIINILLFGKNLIDYEDIKQKLNEM